jgi:hypothetical protein
MPVRRKYRIGRSSIGRAAASAALSPDDLPEIRMEWTSPAIVARRPPIHADRRPVAA